MMEIQKLQMQLGKSQAVLKSCATGTNPVLKLCTQVHLQSPLYTPELVLRQQVYCLVCTWQTVNPHSVHDAPYRFTQEELLAIDLEGRCVITDHEAFILFNLYGPAITSEENAAERFAYKMRLYQVIFNWLVIASMLKAQTFTYRPEASNRGVQNTLFQQVCCTSFEHGQAHFEAQ